MKEYLPIICIYHHVGSTAIPAMPAKDIIDIDIEYTHGSLAMIVSSLKKAGYDYRGDLGIIKKAADCIVISVIFCKIQPTMVQNFSEKL